jgi:hypothetical protein
MKKFFLILGIFFLVNMSCFAQEQTVSNELSLQEAIDLSLSKNLNVQNTRLNVDRAKNDIKIANRLQNPSLETYNNIGAAGRGMLKNWACLKSLKSGNEEPERN